MNKNQNIDIFPEVLAPAGDSERLEMAVLYGAHAVYLGSKDYGMRATPDNFTDQQLAQGVRFAHEHGVRVYLTCNTLPTNEEAAGFEDFLHRMDKVGVDALIVADLGLLQTARRVLPHMELHASTQVGITNYLNACALYELGVKRVVLARELSLEDIAYIRANTPPELELEAFVHGAMCMSVSGRCLLSQYIIGRDANRGACAQPCRWGYHLMEEKRPGEYHPIFEDERGSYILNAKDLCMIEHLDKLRDAGVSSFKIEGRAKSAYYVATITAAYRRAVEHLLKYPDDYALPAHIEQETRKVSHRRYNTGFFFGQPEDGQYLEDGGYVRDWDMVAVVEDWQEGILHCSQRNKFFRGDTLEALVPDLQSDCAEIVVQELYDEGGEAIESAPHPTMLFTMPCATKLPRGTILRKKV